MTDTETNPRGVRPRQRWLRNVRGVGHEVYVLEVSEEGGYARIRGERSSWVNLRTGFDRMTLVYDPHTAPPRIDLDSECDRCGHELLMHGAVKMSSCRKKTCGCEEWSGTVHRIDPMTDRRIA